MNPSLGNNIIALSPSATEEVDNLVKKMKRSGIKDIISLGVGEPCFDTPKICVEASKHALDSGETKYQPTKGNYELREEICKKFKMMNNIDAGVEDVMVTPGAKFAIYLFFQALLEKGDRVLIIEPAWVSHIAIPQIMGAEVITIPAMKNNGFLPDIDLIKRNINDRTKCIIINSPCNPTGAVFEKETIQAIAQLAEKHNALILSDEIYESFIYEGKSYSPASDFSNVVTVNGFSKTYAMTGWRLGYATGPAYVLDGMAKIYQHSASCVTAFAQAGATEALRNPQVQTEVKNMLIAFKKKRQIMLDCLETSDFFTCQKAAGAFYCFPRYEFPASSLSLAYDLLEKAHVATLPGAAFGNSGEKHLRLSYSASDSDISEAMQRIDNYIQQQFA